MTMAAVLSVLFATLVLFVVFTIREAGLKNDFEKKLKELNEQNAKYNADFLNDTRESLKRVAQLEIREFELKEDFSKREEKLISKINHQHATIQRLHKKIQRLE